MRTMTIALSVLAMLALAAPAVAQDQPAGGDRPAAGPGGPRGGSPFAQLDLTAEQKTKVEAIMKAAREKADKAETPQAKAEIRRAAMDDIIKNVLTEEQRKKMEALRANRAARGEGLPLRELNLTAEQKTKADEILKAAREKAAKAETPKEKAEIMKAAYEDIKKNVLTDEQRKKLAELPPPGARMITRRLEPLKLTDEQKGKVKDLLKAAADKADKAEGMEAKRAVWTAAMDDIKKNVLTDEQRKQLESMPAPGRGGRGGRGGAPGGAPGGAGSPPPPPAE